MTGLVRRGKEVTMPDGRMTRRLAAMLGTRLQEAHFDQVRDDRDARGRRWKLETLLVTVLTAMVAGARSLAEAERVTQSLSRAARRWLGIGRRIPDTTLRDALCTLEPRFLAPCLHSLILAAHRRKSLRPDRLPFGIVALDGKAVPLPSCDDGYAQRQTRGEGEPLVGLLRTITATLTSCAARPCIDVTPLPATTNEVGWFQFALSHLMQVYGHLDLFRMVTYDAGACSLANAHAVRNCHLHYLFGLKGSQPTMLQGAQLWLGPLAPEQAAAQTEDRIGSATVVRRIYLGEATDAPQGWDHLRTVLRVEAEKLDAQGRRLSCENRYFICSLARDRLTPEQWLHVIRGHWGVETSHQILDTALLEDDHPWIESNPRAAYALVVLRRTAYTLLALFRSITQRSELRRAVPWKHLLQDIFLTLVTLSDEHLLHLRRRTPLPALA
jgi:hypothetical protein